MLVSQRNKLHEKAKSKKDGVYSSSPYIYCVKNGGLIAYADYFGNVYRCYGMFDSQIGKCEGYDRRKVLKQFI